MSVGTKEWYGKYKTEIRFSVLISLIALLAFGLGRLSVIYGGEGEFEIVYPENSQGASVLEAVSFQVPGSSLVAPEKPEADSYQLKASAYVASKTGSAYHLPWCSGAQRIKEENKIYFETKEEAEAAGYTPAANCKGL